MGFLIPVAVVLGFGLVIVGRDAFPYRASAIVRLRQYAAWDKQHDSESLTRRARPQFVFHALDCACSACNRSRTL